MNEIQIVFGLLLSNTNANSAFFLAFINIRQTKSFLVVSIISVPQNPLLKMYAMADTIFIV